MKQKEAAEAACLPEEFLRKMRSLLGEEAEDFFAGYEKPRRYGLRINPLKKGIADGMPEIIGGLKRIPWTAEGYYYSEELRPGKHPLHEAGLYYIQEPSAMAVVEALAPKPGERILDLCAAPGGKSTQAAGRMGQQGLLLCNEIHPARAKILSQNIERMGIANAVVTNMDPEALAPAFRGFFDGVIVDAPCSGEGMFRKDAGAVLEWSPENVARCAARQDRILDCAAETVRPGGRIVYSTCTFSPEEDEQTVARFLTRHPEYRIVRPECAGLFSPGRPEWVKGLSDRQNERLDCAKGLSDRTNERLDCARGLSDWGNERPDCANRRSKLANTVRIWPHKTDGEGHFLALLMNDGVGPSVSAGSESGGRRSGSRAAKGRRTDAVQTDGFEEFCSENLTEIDRILSRRHFLSFGDNLYLVPDEMTEMSGLKVLRAGLHLGTQKKGRFEPSHALALFLDPREAARTAELGTGETAEKYLRGETISDLEILQNKELNENCGFNTANTGAANTGDGWTLVTAGGYSIGWAKRTNGILKNHYPKGLRRN